MLFRPAPPGVAGGLSPESGGVGLLFDPGGVRGLSLFMRVDMMARCREEERLRRRCWEARDEDDA